MFSEFEEINTQITSERFEQLIKDHLNSLSKEIKNIKVIHNVDLKTNDGTYQIDVYAEFEVFGATFKILIECKRHKNPIKREVVQLIYEKLRSTGSHKAMIFATTRFQEGAINYAEIHGIALVQVIDGRYTYFTRSQDTPNYDPPIWAEIPEYVLSYRKGNLISYIREGDTEQLKELLFE